MKDNSLAFINAGQSQNTEMLSDLQDILDSGMFANMEQFRAQSPVPDGEIAAVDAAVTTVGRKRLDIVRILLDAGMYVTVDNWMAVPFYKKRKVSTHGKAQVSMVPETRHPSGKPDHGSITIPLPCTWDAFDMNTRELLHLRRMGFDADTSGAENATENVNIKTDEIALYGLTDMDGSPMSIDGMTAPGLLASTNVYDYSTWTGLTGTQIIDVVNYGLNNLRLARKVDPAVLILPGNYSSLLNNQFAANYPKTIGQALRELEFAGQKLQVEIAESLPDDKTIILGKNRNNAQMVIGQMPVAASWRSPSGWRRYWMVVACAVFMGTPDADGKYGYVVGSLE